MLRIATTILCLQCVAINIVLSQTIRPISDIKYKKPFGLFYDASNRKLFFADYLLNQIVCYDITEKRTYAATTLPITIEPWYIIPFERDSNKFLVNDGTTNYIVAWDTKSTTAKIIRSEFTVESQYVNKTCTIAKVAPNCELFFGTLGKKLCVDEPNSATYAYNERSGVRTIIPHQMAAGEIEWNEDGSKFYQLSSCDAVVREYDYNRNNGKISGGRIVYTYNGVSKDGLTPVLWGMTLDTKGNLYLASYHGGVVLVVDPKTGKLVREIAIPGPVIGSIAWGDDDMKTLFVSTSNVPRDFYSGINLNKTLTPGSGLLYAVTGLKAQGVKLRKICPNYRFCHK